MPQAASDHPLDHTEERLNVTITESPPRIGSLFSGSGMLDEGVKAAIGGTVAWHVENDPAASKVLAHRYPDVPNLGDVTTIDWVSLSPVDVVTTGFPCTDVSSMGARKGLVRIGEDSTRSGLWAYSAAAIAALRPSLVVIENVRGLLDAEADGDVEPCSWCLGDGAGEPPLRALAAVLSDLAELGFDACWHGLRAADVGAPHGRFRVFVLAWPRDCPPGDAAGLGWDAASTQGSRGHRQPAWTAGGSGGSAPTDCASAERGEPEPPALVPVAVGPTELGERAGEIAWGEYEPAIRRWERRLGRRAGSPAQIRGDVQEISPRFTEWMMGWPEGWVTDVPGVSDEDAIKICGNGVVPQQAAAAVRFMLARLAEERRWAA
jgi:DNA (cytosine-5)-methyltransferase 1